jgi:hypothetical protein
MKKRQKYFVSMHCPWCDSVMGVVNHGSKKSVTATEICTSCRDYLATIAQQHIIFVIEDDWLCAGIQDNKVPIYPFVKGIIITMVPPPSVPMWEGRIAILPLLVAQSMGFPSDILNSMRKAEIPLLFDDTGTSTATAQIFPVMRPGTC